MLVHHHVLVAAKVNRIPSEITCADLQSFLTQLVKDIGMQALFEPIAINGKYGFTGIVGIVTSHIAFHYFDLDQTLHLDVYSCKEYNLPSLMDSIDRYWRIAHATIMFVDRGDALACTKFTFTPDERLQKAQTN